MEPRATSYHSQGLVRALAVLKALGSADQPMSIARLSAELDLPKSTLVRLLSVLEEHDYVFREGNPPMFSIGHAVFELSETYRNQIAADELATPYLRRLAEETGLTANIGVLQGRWVLHVCVEEPSRPLRFRSTSGSLDHAYCTGLGKMLLSALAPADLDDHLPEAPFTRFTERTLTTRAQLERELERTRDRGHSVDAQERDPGVTCLAVPIPGADGSFTAALSVAGPTGELAPDVRPRLLSLLHATAGELAANARFTTSLKVYRSTAARKEAVS